MSDKRDRVEEADDESFPASDPPSWPLGGSAKAGEAKGVGVREVVGVFPTTASLGDAITALQSSGIDRARLSILAGGPEAEQQLRAAGFQRVQDLLDDADAPRMAPVERESVGVAQGAIVSGLFYIGAAVGGAAAFASGVAAIAPIAAAVLGSGAAGGTLGGFLAHLAHGGLVLWARVVTPDEEQRAAAFMREHGGHEVHAHGTPDDIHPRTPGAAT